MITLEQAIRSCSGWPAEILGLADRGLIRKGAMADIVVFDPATFRDAATFDQPTRYAPGVKYLFVNGVQLIAQGRSPRWPSSKGKLPGRALRLDQDGPAELIVRVKRIWTGDRDRPWAEALAARGGTIVAVGATEDVMRFRGPSTRIVERPDAFATPGLIDAHGHMESLGASQEQIDLRGVSSLEEVARRVKSRIEANPGDSWITGRNWDQSLWPGNAFPTATVLDAVALAPSGLAQAGRRPRRLGQLGGIATGQSRQGFPGPRRRADHPRFGRDADGCLHRRGDGTGQSRGPIPIQGRSEAAATGGPGIGAQGRIDRRPRCRNLAPVAESYRELDREGKLLVRIYGMASPPEAARPPFVEPSATGLADGISIRDAGDQALHRWGDGFARRPFVPTVPRRSGQLRIVVDRSQGTRGDHRRRDAARLAGLHSCHR